MNTHKNVIILLFLFSIIGAIAQEPVVTWGNIQQPNNVNDSKTTVLGLINSELYLEKLSGPIYGQTLLVEKYSKEFTKVYSKEIKTSIGVNGDNMLLESVIMTNNNILAFYRGWKKATKQVSCNLQMYSFDCELVGNPIVLNQFTVAQQLNSGNFHISISPDKSKVIVQTDMPYVKGEKEKINIAVFNAQNMEKIWAKDITLTNESEKGVQNDIFVDNTGNAFMFKTQFLPKNAKAYSVFTCNAANQNWIQNNVEISNKLISQYKINFNAKGELALVGFYATQNEDKIEGTFYCKVNKNTLKFDVQKITPLGANLLKNWKSEKAAVVEGASITDFKIKDVLSQSNGNSLIISENTYQSSSNIAPAGSKPEYEYSTTNKDIMVICLNQDGTQAWGTVINKNQIEKSKKSEPSYISFIYALQNDKLFIIWNNVEINILTLPPIKWKDPQGKLYTNRKEFDNNTTNIPPFMNIIEPNGNVVYKAGTYGLPLFTLHKGSPFPLYVNPNVFISDTDGLIILSEMKDGERYRFGKMLLR